MRTLRFRGCHGFQRSCYHGSTRDPTGTRPPPGVPGLRERWWGHWRLVHSRAFKGTVTVGRSHGRPHVTALPPHCPPATLPSPWVPHPSISVSCRVSGLSRPLSPVPTTGLLFPRVTWWPGPFKHSWTRNLSDGCSPAFPPLGSPALGPPGRPLQVVLLPDASSPLNHAVSADSRPCTERC